MVNFNVYIGYDQREDIAAKVCQYSIASRTDQLCPPKIELLRSENIPEYTRPYEATQSTDFTYTRFMIPFLEGYGKTFSVFCDCDFLFQSDVMDLILSVDKTKAISVVKHPPYVPHTQIKMDGVVQHTMQRKNWASLIVFNNNHPSNRKLTPDYVNHVTPGRRLHMFDWLEDNEIGSIPLDWNVLDQYYLLIQPRAIHYTDGGPWFKNYQKTMYSHLWWKEYYDFTNTTKQLRSLSPDT
jgi:hypothetical protein